MNRRNADQNVLVKGTTNSTFDILLRKAEEDGRVGGKYQCLICGMSFHQKSESKACCAMLREKT